MGMLRGRVRVVLGLVALLLSLIAPAHSQQLFFSPPLTYGGSGPAVTADLRGNGKVDIVSGDGTVALSNGDGTFTYPAPIFSLGGSAPGPIAIADFNGDGKPDVLSGLNVYLGNGDGTFQAPRTITTGASVAGVAVADVNGDRRPDVLVLLSGGGVLVFLGKGDGTFTTTNVVYPSSSGQFLVVGDFNGDGKADAVVVVINAGSGGAQGSVQVLLGNGDGTFQPGISTAGEVGSQAVVPEDVNGDGKLDLVMSGPGQTVIFLGNGDGTFHTPGAPLAAGGLLAIADVNGDGKPDVIVSNTFTQVFLGNGDGTFSLKGSVLGLIPVSQLSATSMVVADFNGDGKPDLAVANAILLGNGDGTFRGGSPVLSLAALGALDGQTVGGSGIVGGDFNGHGSPDLAVPAGNNLYILLSDGTGAFLVAHTYPIGTTIGSLAVADLNNDGKLDLLLTVADANAAGVLDLDVMLGNGDGTFAAPTSVIQGLPGQINTAAIADFNDHNTPHIPDLVFGTTQGLEIFLGKGDGTFASPVVYFVPGGSGSDTADFNNDGIPDICAGVSALLGKGDGTFEPPIPNANCVGLAYGDFTGNGKLDTAYSSFDQPVGGPLFALYVSLGNGDGTFTTTQQAVLVPKFTSFPFIVDINGDGKADLVEANGLNILLGNGDGTFGNPIAVLGGCPMCSGPNPVLIADVNGDHRPDAVLALNNGFEAGLITLINVAGPLTPDFSLSASVLLPQAVAAGGAATTTVYVGTGQRVQRECRPVLCRAARRRYLQLRARVDFWRRGFFDAHDHHQRGHRGEYVFCEYRWDLGESQPFQADDSYRNRDSRFFHDHLNRDLDGDAGADCHLHGFVRRGWWI